MGNTNIRVRTQIKIDPTLTTKIKTTTVRGKATLTEPAIVVAQKGTLPDIATKHHFGASGATHDTAACRSKPRSTTPMESPSAGSYHPTQSPDQHNASNHQAVPIHTTQPSPAPSDNEKWAKLLVTCMEEQEYNNREIENRKTYL